MAVPQKNIAKIINMSCYMTICILSHECATIRGPRTDAMVESGAYLTKVNGAFSDWHRLRGDYGGICHNQLGHRGRYCWKHQLLSVLREPCQISMPLGWQQHCRQGSKSGVGLIFLRGTVSSTRMLVSRRSDRVRRRNEMLKSVVLRRLESRMGRCIQNRKKSCPSSAFPLHIPFLLTLQMMYHFSIDLREISQRVLKPDPAKVMSSLPTSHPTITGHIGKQLRRSRIPPSNLGHF